MLQLRRWRNEINEIHEALNQDLQPLLEKAGGAIGPGSDGWEEFVEGAEDLFEPTNVDLSPIPLDSLQGLTERDDFAMSTGLFEVLIRAGIVQE